MNFTVTTKNDAARVTLNEKQNENGIILVGVNIHFDTPVVPSPVIISWNKPIVDIWSVWNPTDSYQRNIGPSWRRRVSSSRLAKGAPVQIAVSRKGMNRMAVALSDALTPCDITFGVIEKTAELSCEVKFFTQQINPITDYSAEIYLDFNEKRFDRAVKDVEAYWSDFCGYPSAYIPDAARAAVYSSWYTFHQDVTAETLLHQCKLAKPLGMDTVILDDGWQIDYTSKGYSKCGDWIPFEGKFPDMKAFVDEVHKLGMKLVLWIHLPALGQESLHYEALKEYTLNPEGDGQKYFDPRYPYIRNYLCNQLQKNALEWGIDGYKLDFIDSFRYFPDTKTFDERWDTLSVDEGVDKLLSGIVDTLRSVNPEFLVEFRQYYYGPIIRKYGNMIRVGDCPNDSIRNHVAGTDLRLVLGKTPVHSDMLMWHKDDTVENAAMQVISTLYLVPQISVKLDEITPDQYRMLSFYLKFRNEHICTLMDGNFTAEYPEYNYGLVRSDNTYETIAVAYAHDVLNVTEDKAVYFINSSAENVLYIDSSVELKNRRITIFNATGDVVSQSDDNISPGINRFEVPLCGMIEIK